MSQIVAEGLYKIFGPRPERAFDLLDQGESKEEIQARTGLVVGVQDASFTVSEGETFVVMGLSGSGKSTLLRLLNRLLEPTRGSVQVAGVEVTQLGSRDLIQFRRDHFGGMVFQKFAILPNRNVLDNVAFGLELQGMEKDQREEKARAMIDLVGLSGHEASYPRQLSGGMQQRVGLARALVVEAEILLMDEAFSALDPLIRHRMQDELLELQERLQRTIVFVTHDLDEAFRVGDRIAIMNEGAVVQTGTAEEIVLNPANDYVRSFVQNMDRTQVFRAQTVMEPPPGEADEGMVDEPDAGAGASVSPDTTLAQVIRQAAEHPGPVAVRDEDGQLVGVIPRNRILEAMDRDFSPSGTDTNGAAAQVSTVD